MSEKSEKMQVLLKYKDLEQKFSAQPEEAWLLINQFFKELIPSFEIAQKLWLNIDVKQLAKDMSGIVVLAYLKTTLYLKMNCSLNWEKAVK